MATLVYILACLSFLDHWVAISIVIELSSHLMRVKVMLFHIEWGWYLTLCIKHALIEHLLTIVVIDDVTIFVNQVASLVSWLSIFVKELTVGIWLNNSVALFITIKSSHDITLVKSS